MAQYRKALLLGAGMIAVAGLSIVGIIPEGFAQFAPLALLALFPSVWLGRDCRTARGA